MKELTWKELYKLAMRNYENGGDIFFACWDESTFNSYVAEFGPITEEAALKLFEIYQEICY